MLFNVTCRELAHQMGWSSSFSICYMCWELGTTLLLWGIMAQAVGTGSSNARTSKKLICIQPAGISRGTIRTTTPPLLKKGCVLVPCPANSCLWWENYRWYRAIISINSGRDQCRRVSSGGRQRATSRVLAWAVVPTNVQESLLLSLQINKYGYFHLLSLSLACNRSSWIKRQQANCNDVCDLAACDFSLLSLF